MLNFTEMAWLYEGLLYVVMGIIVLGCSKYIIEWLSPFKVDQELIHSDNTALGVTLAGYYSGVVIIYLGAVLGETPGEQSLAQVLAQTGIDLAYGLAGILALNLCRFIVDKMILYTFCTTKEIVTDRNIGTSAVESGSMIATALMIAGAIHGEGSVLSALVFIVLGQILLIVFGRFHQMITPYDVHEEIEKDNAAAGAYMGFNMIALGVITMKAIAGDFVSWTYNLSYFALYGLIGFLCLMILQKLVTSFFLAGACLEEEIAKDRNMNIAWVGGPMVIGISVMFFFLM